MSLSLAFICHNETDSLRRMLKSIQAVKPDQLCAGWNGDNPETLSILEEFGCEVHRWQWNDNFSDARNHIYSKCSGDYIIYLDSDEELIGGELLRKWLDTEPEFLRAWITLDYYRNTMLYWKLRIVKNGVFRMFGALHDIFVPIEGADISGKDVYLNDIWVKHYHEVTQGRGERNIRVTGKEYRERPTEKTMYDYALSLYEGDEHEQAIPLLRQVIDSEIETAYKMQSLRMLVAIHIERNEPAAVTNYARQMIMLNPEKPDGYFKLAMAYYLAADWPNVIQASVDGFSRDHIPDGMPVIYEEYSLHPAKIYICGLVACGQTYTALKVVRETLRMYPQDTWLKAIKAQIKGLLLSKQVTACKPQEV